MVEIRADLEVDIPKILFQGLFQFQELTNHLLHLNYHFHDHHLRGKSSPRVLRSIRLKLSQLKAQFLLSGRVHLHVHERV